MCTTEAERLRREVVTEIRSNQALEEDLNTMDIKIGLLVKNRITLQVAWMTSLYNLLLQNLIILQASSKITLEVLNEE